MAPLAAAQLLTAATTGELWAVATLCGAKAPKKADKHELVHAILACTHPKAGTPPPAQSFEQTRFC